MPASPGLILLSGWRGVGKTSLLQKLIGAAQKARWMVRGLLTPARLENGEKTGIHVVDAQTGSGRLLASNIAGELRGLQFGPWTFDGEAFAWGNALLQRALPCDLFVLDELGPLEFDRQQGWTAGFEVLPKPASFWMAVVVVVRPEYVQAALQRWPLARVVTLQKPAEIDELVRELLGCNDEQE